MKKAIQYTFYVFILIALLVGSVKIQKLDQFKAVNQSESISIEKLAEEIWVNKMQDVTSNAPDIGQLINELENNPESTCEQYGKKLGISKTWYFVAKGEGVVIDCDKNKVQLDIGNNKKIDLATSYIFGNAVRDGSGLVDINQFVNMTDFNTISIELNRLVRNKVVTELTRISDKGNTLAFSGAFEYNEKNPDIHQLRLIPISIQKLNE